jgi:5-methylcytosine-specific restriction endonuclease McrA
VRQLLWGSFKCQRAAQRCSMLACMRTPTRTCMTEVSRPVHPPGNVQNKQYLGDSSGVRPCLYCSSCVLHAALVLGP